MAGTLSEDYGGGRSSEGILSSQRHQSGDSLVEWRSCEQVENGIPSTSPPYWDEDDEDDCGAKPSELYGKFTWKIENFSQISKRELRSNAFEVGGYKWYILIYPQGCDVCNHLSLFLCVANHEKLLPGWSHFAQFTIAVVNKDPKKSKYSDTLHRFWKKEHDWGWKKFMELSKVLDGFVVADTLVIKAQVQVIREKAHHPFRCLDCQYRRELVRVYLSNVEQICRRFVEERRGKLGKLIEDQVRWSSFCDFWFGVDQNARRRMSREKADVILKIVVKHFFIEKEVTSTLVMDSLYSGLKALEGQSKSKKAKTKVMEMEEIPAPIVRVEKDMFVLADDVLLLLERAALEPLPPKEEKGPQIRTKDVSAGEDFNKDSIERDERRLTELGRRTVEIFVLAHIFSNKIEVAYQEAVALKRQEELIREEEAAGQVESEQKAKRGAAEKEKRNKKKQAKQKRSSRKGKDRGKDEKSDLVVQGKHQRESFSGLRTLEVFSMKHAQSVLEKPDTLEDVSDVSDTDIMETLQPDLEDRDAGPVNSDTDTSEVMMIHPPTEASSSGTNCLPIQNGGADMKITSLMDDSSSTCSTDSVPSVVLNGPYKGNSVPSYHKSRTSPNRGKNQRRKDTYDRVSCAQDPDNQLLDPAMDSGCKGTGPESEAVVLSLKDRIHWLEQHLVEKEEEVVSLQKKLNVKDDVDVNASSKQMTAKLTSSTSSPTKILPPLTSQPKPAAAEPVPFRETPSKSPSQTENIGPLARLPQVPSTSKLDAQAQSVPAKSTGMPIEKPTTPQLAAVSRPSSAPLIPGPRPPAATVVSMVQSPPSLARSVSAAGRLGTDPSPATQSYVPQSYRNAIMGKATGASSSVFSPRHSSSTVNVSPVYTPTPSSLAPAPAPAPSSSLLSTSSQSSVRMDQTLVETGFSFGSVVPDVVHNQHKWSEESSQRDLSLQNSIPSHDIYSSGGGRSQMCYADQADARQAQGVSADEFPHLDIIDYLFDEEQISGNARDVSVGPRNNGQSHPHHLNRLYTFPGDAAAVASVSQSVNNISIDHMPRYQDDRIHRVRSTTTNGRFDGSGRRDTGSQVGLSLIDGVIQNQWQVGNNAFEGEGYLFQMPDYAHLACGVNGYMPMFRPANGH